MQPVLDEREDLPVNLSDANDVFLSCLEELAYAKVHLELGILMNDDQIFYHTVNEIILFMKNLAENYRYRSELLQRIMNHEKSFDLWLQLERRYFESKFEEIRSNQGEFKVTFFCVLIFFSWKRHLGFRIY